jgi:hypothetical protein
MSWSSLSKSKLVREKNAKRLTEVVAGMNIGSRDQARSCGVREANLEL